jgi:hypothetical protein
MASSVNFTNHLKKINQTQGAGTKLGYCRLVCLYVLNYWVNRPVFVNLRSTNSYGRHKKLFYTVITGDYDQLNEIPQRLTNWDYVCFTDNPDIHSKTWRIEALKNKLDLDPVRLSRYLKINNHLVDADYYLSVYADANLRIRGNLDDFLVHALPAGKPLGMVLHPFHSSLAEEVELCAAIGKDAESLLRAQYNYYVEEKGFDDLNPHVTCRLIVRRSNNAATQKLMETWFSELLKWSRRDQLSFNYSLAHNPDVKPHYIPYWLLRCYFKKMDHAQ